MFENLKILLGLPRRRPPDLGGAAFYRSLQRRQAAGTITEDAENRGLSFGDLLVEDLLDSEVTLVIKRARYVSTRLGSVERCSQLVTNVINDLRLFDLSVISGQSGNRSRVTVMARDRDLLKLSFAELGAFLRLQANGPDGLNLAIAVARRLGFRADREEHAYESRLPLSKVITAAYAYHHVPSDRFIIELHAVPKTIKHIRLGDGGTEYVLFNGILADDVRCLVTEGFFRPPIHVNNLELGPTKPLKEMTAFMRQAAVIARLPE